MGARIPRKREAHTLHAELSHTRTCFSLTIVVAEHCVSDDGVLFLPCENKHPRRAAAEVALVEVQPPFAENDHLVAQKAVNGVISVNISSEQSRALDTEVKLICKFETSHASCTLSTNRSRQEGMDVPG